MSRRKGRAKGEETPRHGDAETRGRGGNLEKGKRGREEERKREMGVGGCEDLVIRDR